MKKFLSFSLWFTKRGGWEHKNTQESFLRFVEKIVSEFKNDVKFWIVMSEPETAIRRGYTQGIRMPQKKIPSKHFWF